MNQAESLTCAAVMQETDQSQKYESRKRLHGFPTEIDVLMLFGWKSEFPLYTAEVSLQCHFTFIELSVLRKRPADFLFSLWNPIFFIFWENVQNNSTNSRAKNKMCVLIALDYILGILFQPRRDFFRPHISIRHILFSSEILTRLSLREKHSQTSVHNAVYSFTVFLLDADVSYSICALWNFKFRRHTCCILEPQVAPN